MRGNSASNDNGRAFEHACMYALKSALNAKTSHPTEIDSNYSPHIAAQNAWNNISVSLRLNLSRAAKTAAEYLFKLEPMLDEHGDDPVRLIIQPDTMGEYGDVRDIVIMREKREWSIGLSVKHNHFAVKHSRIASDLDFGDRWYKHQCSDEYWKVVEPVFTRLKGLKEKGMQWSDLSQEDKWQSIYVPLLTAFKDEIIRQSKTFYDIPKRMVEYLLGGFDFYKVISIDAQEKTRFQTFNIRGTLNRRSEDREPSEKIAVAHLPSKILHFDFKEGSKTTLVMCLNEGWQFTFRIHNGDGRIIPSLKFDVQIKGMPTEIQVIDVVWLKDGCIDIPS